MTHTKFKKENLCFIENILQMQIGIYLKLKHIFLNSSIAGI